MKVTSLGANASPDGRLVALFTQDDLNDDQEAKALKYSLRQSVLVSPALVTPAPGTETIPPTPVTQAASATPESTPAATMIPENLPTSSSAPALTPTIMAITQTGPVSLNSRFSGPVIGGVLALLVVGLAAGLTLVVVRRSARKR